MSHDFAGEERAVPFPRLEATVRGRVQGVGFRYFVVRRALELGLVGWVANGADGSVRCVAEGPSAALDALEVDPPDRSAGRDRRCGRCRPDGGHRSARTISGSDRAHTAATEPSETGSARPSGACGNRTAPDRDFQPRATGPVSRTRSAVGDPSFIVMESRPPADPAPAEPVATLAEDLPEIYRAILDRVADLERIGARREAGRSARPQPRPIRTPGTSRRDAICSGLLGRAQQGLVVTKRSRGWSLRRRSIAVR